jgi:hypothetical protein
MESRLLRRKAGDKTYEWWHDLVYGIKIDWKQFLNESDFTAVSDSKVTLILGVAVRISAWEIKSNLHFECSRSTVGMIAIVQSRKVHELTDDSSLLYKEIC